MRETKHRIGLGLLTVVVCVACSSGNSGGGGGDDAGAGCSSDADCKGSATCKAGQCVDPGAGDSGAHVDAGSCKHPGDGCGSNTDCCQTDPKAPKGAVCIASDNVCHAKCYANSECESGCCAAIKGESYGACAVASACCECSAGTYSCTGTTTLETCDDGCHWTANSCASICKTAGYDGASGCSLDSSKGHDTCDCFYGGIGDACSSDSTCVGGNYCEGGAKWCGRSSCSTNVDCLGTGLGGRNHTNGYFNYCFRTTGGGAECFPGCSTDADCLAYGFGACKAYTDIEGTTHYACSAP
jgi:hypothetical protein